MARTEGSHHFGPVKRGVAASVAALGLGGFIGACDSGKASPGPTPSASQQFNPNGNPEINYYLAQKGPCIVVPPFLSTRGEVRKNNIACFDSQRGPIAIVNFGQPEGEVKQIVSAMTRYLRIGSDGLVEPQFKVINASAAAEKDLQKVPVTAKGCVDVNGNPQYSASFIAGYTMQRQLRGEDYILAFSTEKPCGFEAGQADIESDKYADIYTGTLHSKKDLPQIIAVGGAHEIFHLLRLGHDGDYGQKTQGFLAPFLLRANNRPFDLAKYLKKYTYDEYSFDYSDNIMGSYYPIQYVQNPVTGKTKVEQSGPPRSNPIQINALLQPETATKGNGILKSEVMSSHQVILTPEDVKNDKYAMAHLTKSVKLTDRMTGASYEFDTVAFVPQPYGNKRINNVAVYLVSFDDAGYPQTTIVNIGTLLPGKRPIDITFHNQTFNIKNVNDSLALQTTTR